MNLTLRRAKAIQTSIIEAINALTIETHVSIGEFDNAETTLNEKRNEVLSNVSQRRNLWNALYEIRSQVAKANVKGTVSNLLAEQANLEKNIADLALVAASNPATTLSVIRNQQQKLQDSAKASVYHSFGSISTGMLNSDDIAGFKAEISKLKKLKQEVNDALLEQNIRTEISLNDSTVAILASHKIL